LQGGGLHILVSKKGLAREEDREAGEEGGEA
jgi:hypothetical protein